MTNDDRRLLIVTAKAVASMLTGHGDQGKLRQEIWDLSAKLEAVQGREMPKLEGRRENWHYDSQGYCDNPGRGY